MRVLVVEDDQELAQVVVDALREECYAVELAVDGATADELAAIHDYDLVILDWGIPPPTGIELLRSWRAQGKGVPVLMLTARREVEERIEGLDTGADDYLTKPFAVTEMLARVRSLLRRREQQLCTLGADDLKMDRRGRVVSVAGEPVELTRMEFAVLDYLLRHVDEVVPRSEIEEHVWDDASEPMSNVQDVIIYRLRKKIDGEREKKLLETVKGVGYRLRSRRV